MEEIKKRSEVLAGLSKEERYKMLLAELNAKFNPKPKALNRFRKNSMKSYNKPFGK